jgi:hypothetical protein
MRRAGAVLLAAAVLTGCGGATGSSLEDAADATAADTSRFEMTYDFAALGGEKGATFRVEGAFDYPNERGVMTLSDEFPFLDEGMSLEEFRLVGRTGYTRWIVKGKTYWVKEHEPETSGDPIEHLIPFPGTATKPTDVLTRVLGASEQNEVLGQEDVRGAETTHYRARVSVAKLIEQLPAADRPEGDFAESWGGPFIPVDLWIDDESRLRRITIQQPEDAGSGRAAMTLKADLYDYGVKVDVEPPPADETISQEEFDKLTAPSEPLVGESASGEVEAMRPGEVCESARKELSKREADEVCLTVKKP